MSVAGPLTGKNATDRVSAVLSRAAIRDYARNISSVRVKGTLRTTIHLRQLADPEQVLAVLDGLPGSRAWRQSAETIVVTWDSDKVGAAPLTFSPTPIQAATVAALDALSRPPQWKVDAAPLDADAPGACENDWAHGPGTVVGGPCDGMCLACAVQVLIGEARHPASRTVSLDVLREALSGKS